MRSSRSTAALLSIILASSASAVSPSKSECIHTRNQELAQLASCGHDGSIAYCFSALPEYFQQTDLETCFVNAGCTPDEAQVESLWTLRRCDNPQNLGDLRRRQTRPTQTPGSEDEDEDAEATTSPAQRTTARQTTTERQTTEEQTTTEEKTTEARQTTEDETTSQNAETTTTPLTTAAPATQALTTSGPLICSTTTTKSTTSCPVQTNGNRLTTLSCFPTQVSFATCAAGLKCMTDSGGKPTCLRLQTTLDTAGVVIALFFAVAATSAVAFMCYFGCREKKQQKRIKARAEAALIAKAAAVNGKRPTIQVRNVSSQSVNQPLMPAGQNIVYETHEQDPFHDRHRQ